MVWRQALAATAALVVMTATTGALGTQAQSPAYRAGLKVAQKRQYERPDCYARVFSQHARLSNHRTTANFWSIEDGPRFSTAVWNECRISR